MSLDRLAAALAALADRYRIEHELGAGGMATVYLAEDLKHDRKVAIKWVRNPFSWVATAAVLPSAGMAWKASRPQPEPPAIREMLSLTGETVLDLDLSRDGRRKVYSTRSEIFVRDIDRTEVRRLESRRRARLSTDGRHVAFSRLGDRRLWVMPVDGGSAEVRADSVNAHAWGDDGHLSASWGRVVLRIPPTAGPVDTVARLDAEPGRNPVVQDILPGSRAAVGFRTTPEWRRTELVFIDFASQEVRPLGLTGRTARYVDAGFLVLLEGPTFFDTRVSVVRFDARNGRVPRGERRSSSPSPRTIPWP